MPGSPRSLVVFIDQDDGLPAFDGNDNRYYGIDSFDGTQGTYEEFLARRGIGPVAL